MDDRRVVFKRVTRNDSVTWRTTFEGRERGLCFSGVSQYVDLPDRCMSFDAVFSENEDVDKPGYEIIMNDDTGYVGLDIEDDPDLFSETEYFLRAMYLEGYRYLHVEYDNV